MTDAALAGQRFDLAEQRESSLPEASWVQTEVGFEPEADFYRTQYSEAVSRGFDAIAQDGTVEQLNQFALTYLDALDSERMDRYVNETSDLNPAKEVDDWLGNAQSFFEETEHSNRAVAKSLSPTFWESGVVMSDGTVEIFDQRLRLEAAIEQVIGHLNQSFPPEFEGWKNESDAWNKIDGMGHEDDLQLDVADRTYFVRQIASEVSHAETHSHKQ